MNKNFWEKKTVFITGHSGFKGTWLSTWLTYLGARVVGYSLMPNSSPNLFDLTKEHSFAKSVFGDVNDYQNLKKHIEDEDPDVIFHLASQPLVRESYMNPMYTFETNIIGTVNLLEIVKRCKRLKSLLIVTSDKCYLNENLGKKFNEKDKLGGNDPYSASKACQEIVTLSYLNSYFGKNREFENVNVATVRAGNIIGGGDWSKERLVPDIMRSIFEEKQIIIRSPDSIRPWQYILDPLKGYLTISEKLYSEGKFFSGPWNFGPNVSNNKDVKWIYSKILNHFNIDEVISCGRKNNFPEAKFLALDISKAKNRLNWYPKININKTLELTSDWYKEFYKKKNICS